jgi:hypothetical protein
MGVYYSNIWRSQDFPFLSQQLYTNDSTFTNYSIYNESLILNADLTINNTLVDEIGIPWLTGTYVAQLITFNAGFTANFVHMFLWNYKEIKIGWSFVSRKNLLKLITPSTYFFWNDTGRQTEEEKEELRNDPTIDPHYKVMLEYVYFPSYNP